MKSLFKQALFAAFLMGLSWAPPSLAGEELIIASRENTITNRFAERLLSEAYSRLNINVKFAIYPGARSVEEANAGRADGEAVRLKSVLTRYPNLRMVPVPLFHSELSAFSHEKYKVDISDWQSLTPYSLTTVRGFEYVQNKLADKSSRIVKTSSQAIQMVEGDLVEVAILNRFLGTLAIAKVDAKHVKEHSTISVKVHNPPLASVDMYIYVHKDYADLAPRLAGALRQIKADGTFQKIIERTLIPLLSNH